MARKRELAREIRAGLTVINGNKMSSNQVVNKQLSELDKLYYRKPIRQHVREFGALFAAIALIIAAVQIYNNKPILSPSIWLGVGVIFSGLGYLAPAMLHPFWKGWMKFAQILGGVMTVLLLGIAWMIVLMPVSMILKILQKKIMNVEFKQDVPTYWENRSDKLHDFKLLNKQF